MPHRPHLLVPALFALLLLVCAAPAAAAVDPPREKLQVVCTIPDLEDIAREIGGDRLEITCLAKGTQNIHAVAVRPSHLVAVNRADLFIQIGLSLEHAFVPGLLQAGRNTRIQPGRPGFLNCSEGWEALNVPVELSRSQAADLHPLGNPHMNLDPRAGAFLADRILEGLLRVDPQGSETYRTRHADYKKRVEEAAKRWSEVGASFRGKQVVTYHQDFTYFAEHYGIVVVAQLEPRPGVPPSPRDLAAVVQTMREQEVGVILTAKWSNNKDLAFVAEKTGARVLEIPVMVDGTDGASSWIAMMDRLHDALAAAL